MENTSIKISIIIRAQTAETGPPLGTVLGNLGVNTIKFCKEFNDFTQDLPNYLKIKVVIIIAENKNFYFFTKAPQTGFILSLLKKDNIIFNKDGTSFIEEIIEIEDLLKLAKFKFPKLDFKRSIPILLGSLNSANLKVIY